ncbi:MAG TPA: PQQ-dependent sugar dehydrogenase [Thermoanaerobaculia bacterium]|nr:PQQ-dependent sugar dehydrogenase [Thermoanaerobaculia bacterium]
MRATALSLIALVTVPLFAAVELQPVVSGLDLPVAITHAGDSRLFITLQRGRIVIWDGTRILPDPFLDIRSRVFCGNSGSCGERGLLSVAFHPRYAENGRFFVYYTDLQGDIVIARYNVSADRDRADPSSAAIILEIPHQQFSNHNGGQLQFGPDGFLYPGTGDGGSGGDPFNNAQNLSSLLGKLLRIDVDGAAYTVPPSNPFAGGGGRGEIWAYGLRNPWRFSFDRANGDLWIADVGQGDWEEIDFQPASSRGGENYGWRRMEGTHCFPPSSTNCRDASFTLPVIEYDHSARACSVTGGFRYRGRQNPNLQGMYIYGDYCNGLIWAATLRTDGTWSSRELIASNVFISSFGEDLNGEIYVAAHGGAIFRLIDTTPPLPKRRAVRR